jgi:2-dehydro-3-deoxyphosphogluconate aldolase / (4S)-4-hydroxy-2-oxoglutarate aldolase
MAIMNSQFPEQMLQTIERSGVVSVLILDNADHAVPLAKALMAGGINAMELTLRTDAAIESLKRIRQQVPEMLAGIGTVLTVEQVDEVAAAGGQFAVSPGLNPDVVERAQEIGLPFAPGVMTPSEIEVALELGCRELKFFPAVPCGGLPMLDSVRAPYAHLGIRFLPLGGINENNMTDWLSNPGVFAIGGSWLTPKDVIARENWEEVTRRAAEARKIADNVLNTAT